MNDQDKNFDNLIRVRVSGIRSETRDIRRMNLVSEDGSPLPGFSAGSHVDLVVHLPDHSRALRSYSIASAPDKNPVHYTLAILYEEESTGGSVFLHEKIRNEYIMEMSHPKNYFPLSEESEHSILIAGGIGITPILSMAYELQSKERSFELHYVTRSIDHMAFKKTIEDAFGNNSNLYFDDGEPSKGIDIKNLFANAKNKTHIYVCGPKGIINTVLDEGKSRNWDESSIHYEIFTPPEPLAGDTSIEVFAAKSNITLQVSEDQTILEALEKAGIDCDYDCRMGICGTCATKVLEGKSAHRDNVLLTSEHEDGQMCTCVSRALTPRLVLDI